MWWSLFDANWQFTIGEHNNSVLNSKVALSDDGNQLSMMSKIDKVSGYFHPTITQTHECSGQSWGINVAKDYFRCDNKSCIGNISNVMLSDDSNFSVVSSDDDNWIQEVNPRELTIANARHTISPNKGSYCDLK